jgi:hypothetical protein
VVQGADPPTNVEEARVGGQVTTQTL